MKTFHLIDTDSLVVILAEYTSEYNKKTKAGLEAETNAIKAIIRFLQKLIGLREHNLDIARSAPGIDDFTTSKN